MGEQDGNYGISGWGLWKRPGASAVIDVEIFEGCRH